MTVGFNEELASNSFGDGVVAAISIMYLGYSGLILRRILRPR